ncbi:hypothetical protein Gpo141_00014597, partial [Globisporangium polare]
MQHENQSLLSHALRLEGGVIAFLTLSDALALLDCAASLHDDAELALTVLLSKPARAHGVHFFQQCEQDWFDLNPKRITTTVGLFAGCSRGCAAGEPTRRPSRESARRLRGLSTPENPGVLAHLVALVASLDAKVLPVCASMEKLSSDDICKFAAIPVVISLREHHPHREQRRSGRNKWTRNDICLALNAIHEGFGDDFTHRHAPFESLFGMHWDNIELLGQRGESEPRACEDELGSTDDGTSAASVDDDAAVVVCRLCEAKHKISKDYMIEAKELKAERHADRRQDEIDRLRDNDYDQQQIDNRMHWYETDDSGDESDSVIVDNILANPTRAALFPPPFPAQNELKLSTHALQIALSTLHGFTGLCESLSRPLKRTLLADATLAITETSRIEYKWLDHDAISVPSGPSGWRRAMTVELVGGVTRAG